MKQLFKSKRNSHEENSSGNYLYFIPSILFACSFIGCVSFRGYAGHSGYYVTSIFETRLKHYIFQSVTIHFAAHQLDPRFITQEINFDASAKKHVVTRDQTLLGNEMIQDRVIDNVFHTI